MAATDQLLTEGDFACPVQIHEGHKHRVVPKEEHGPLDHEALVRPVLELVAPHTRRELGGPATQELDAHESHAQEVLVRHLDQCPPDFRHEIVGGQAEQGPILQSCLEVRGEGQHVAGPPKTVHRAFCYQLHTGVHGQGKALVPHPFAVKALGHGTGEVGEAVSLHHLEVRPQVLPDVVVGTTGPEGLQLPVGARVQGRLWVIRPQAQFCATWEELQRRP
mmetsp:Transcript_116346/g.202311  ORF Transcript_116346/g.202311 Transcript_116346/m.202311 type:complete len:220 (-) Transcript_116346:670-1329(-)